MTDNGNTILREALALPPDERAQVAADLLASLDESPDSPGTVASAWADETERRARQVLADPSSGQPWATVRNRVAGRLAGE